MNCCLFKGGPAQPRIWSVSLVDEISRSSIPSPAPSQPAWPRLKALSHQPLSPDLIHQGCARKTAQEMWRAALWGVAAAAAVTTATGQATVTITAFPAYDPSFGCTSCATACADYDNLVDAQKRVSGTVTGVADPTQFHVNLYILVSSGQW